MRIYRSKISRSIHQTATDLYRGGGFSDEEMRQFDESCLVGPLRSREVGEILKRESISHEDLARELDVPTELVERWEKGEGSPDVPSLRLLDLVRRKGIEAIR